MEGVKSRLDEEEDLISDLEDKIERKTTQQSSKKKKKNLKKRAIKKPLEQHGP